MFNQTTQIIGVSVLRRRRRRCRCVVIVVFVVVVGRRRLGGHRASITREKHDPLLRKSLLLDLRD